MADTCALKSEELWNPGELTPRIAKLREEYVNIQDRDYFRNEIMPFTTATPWDTMWSPVLWGVVPDLLPFNQAFMETLPMKATKVDLPADFWDKPLEMRAAIFFHEVVSRYLPVQILDDELIVGAQFNTAMSRVQTKSESKEWKKRTDKWVKGIDLLNSHGMGNAGATPGHLIPDYPRALELGLRGMINYFEELKAETKDPDHVEFLDALITCCEGGKELAQRYAHEARRLAFECSDATRKAELEEIARICEKVPWNPPETFHEALQALWFVHMLVMVQESYPGPGLSPGRIDQYLFPYYEKDLAVGRLTRETAKELLECFWIKPNYAYDFIYRVGRTRGITSGYGQLITIGGIGPDGEDASNDLTWLLLDIIEEMNLLEPKPNVRLHKNTPDDLLKRVAGMIASAQGAPFLLNFDENSIAALRWQGLPEERLWDYAPVGCLENTLQGDDRSGTVDVNVNLAKAVELTLFNGKDQETGDRLGPKTGDPRSFRSWEEFKTAFETQLKALLQRFIDFYNFSDALRADFEPTPYLSALVGGCAESGRDVTDAGPEYNFVTVEGVAFATAADSLGAIRKLVYEDKTVSMDDLIEAVDKNYEGFEKLRQTLVNKGPKYGNDDDYADGIARYLSKLWTEEVFEHMTPSGRRYRGGYLSWNYWIAYAPTTAATPDGRKRGTFLSNGMCPVDGADRNGPTAVALSVGKLGLESAPNGDSHTISFSPSILRGQEHVDKLASYLRAYGEKGGTALQINVIDPETLRCAQENPADYANLLVRVTGYNAYFVMLGKEIQDEIIARESHKL
ncbi:MAG TPA: pyruvate formate lyase family protein [Candidatus Anoxymicrobiaceae bacterium]